MILVLGVLSGNFYKPVSWVVLAAWLGSLALPAYKCGGSGSPDFGAGVLAFGWVGLIAGEVRWLGNPILFLLISRLQSSVRKPSVVVSALAVFALALAVSAVFFPAQVCAGASYTKYKHLLAGGFLWVTAVGGAAIAVAIGEIQRFRRWSGPSGDKEDGSGDA